jgi:hypothetical protein
MRFALGQAVPRTEDPRLLTGSEPARAIVGGAKAVTRPKPIEQPPDSASPSAGARQVRPASLYRQSPRLGPIT